MRSLGTPKNLAKEIATLFEFTNNVVETSLETPLKGNIQTRFGTDFNYIAQSILERDFDKAVMIHRRLCVNVRWPKTVAEKARTGDADHPL
jgi:hypothetical protein